jgi:polyisoprenyl-phosphate glycosyltransferase
MSAAPPVLWLVSPVYLDVESYLLLRAEVLEILGSRAALAFREIRFVAVDDTGGLDPEVDRLRGVPGILVIQPPFNLGHQRALVFGLRVLRDQLADHDYVVTLDADGEDRPADLPELLAPLLATPENTRKVAVARRTRRRESLRFKVLYFFFRILFRALTGLVVRSGNYVAYRGWLARRLLFHPHFDLCYSSSFISLNLQVDLVPLERGHRYAGQSRMSYGRLLRHGFHMLLPFTDQIAVRALVMFAVTFGISALVLVAGIVLRLFSLATPSGWTSAVPLIIMVMSFVAVGNLVTLFAAFSQSRGTSLKNLEREQRGGAGKSSTAPD